MTPLEIEIILYYYSRTNDYRDMDFSAPAVRQAIDWMKAEGVLLEDGTNACYRLGERGHVYDTGDYNGGLQDAVPLYREQPGRQRCQHFAG